MNRPCGIDVIHEAIENLTNGVPRAEWKAATVSVAPSTVTISYASDEKGGGGNKRQSRQKQLDCRVRFLSFLGIGLDTRQCAFIMHTAQDTFVAHVFHVEPTAGPLCKTIEAACKLRYQKCLDARPQQQRGHDSQSASGPGQSNSSSSATSSIGASIKSMLFKGRSRLLSPPSSSTPS